MKVNLLPANYSDAFNALPLLIGLILAGTAFHSILLPSISLKSERLTYLHYNFIKVYFKSSEQFFKGRLPQAHVYKNDRKITTIGKQDTINFEFNDETRLWHGKFPVPWGAPEGMYAVRLLQNDRQVGWDEVFYIKTRIPAVKFSHPLKILNLESMRRLKSFKIRNPSGEKVGYTGIFDWIKYIGGNTLWYIAGQTASYKKGSLTESSPWVKDNLDSLEEFAGEAKSRNIDFGAWISCFRVFGKKSLKPDWYNYSYKYKRGSNKVVESEGISILDHRRIEDIIKLTEKFNNMESIDYIGLDYIRTVGDGLDLVDEFVQAMYVKTPYNWKALSKIERMEWLGRFVTRTDNRDVPVIDKWNWWRAQRVSKIISLLKERVNLKKPLWTFVLSWELGHQHGQDPIMFQDAGSDLIAVMMYETDGPRFDHIIEEWKDYLTGFNINIVMGNQIDWVLHQYTVYPSGPAEYARRIEKSAEYMDKIDNLKGLFIHDFSRAMRGRLGPYTPTEWLMAASRSFTKLTSQKKIAININVSDRITAGEKIYGSLEIINISDTSLNNIKFDFPKISGVEVLSKPDLISELKVKESKTIRFDVKINGMPDRRMGRYMVAARAVHGEEVYSDFKTFWVKGVSVDNGSDYR